MELQNLIPWMALVVLMVLAIITLYVLLARNMARRPAIILAIPTLLILVLDTAAVRYDIAIWHYLVTGKCKVYKMGTLLGRMQNGDASSFCFTPELLIANATLIILLAIFVYSNRRRA